MNKSKINSLLIEDNLSSQALVKSALQGVSEITTLDHGNKAIETLKTQLFDLLLLDVDLPDVDGFHLCTLIRNDPQLSRLPIILLTGKSGDTDRIMGLTLGADDYITKPFHPGELRARVLALIRRTMTLDPSTTSTKNLKVGNLKLSIETQRALVSESEIEHLVNLTTIEFKILKLLMGSIDRVFSRNEIIDLVWGNSTFITERTVDTHMSNLRKKLKSAGELVKSVHGSGYRLSNSN
ncbi:MAG: hypothetical protein A4S09_03710 [Proteobacteria bacterium SG_bin7]|nr:MAG: hypothetical protein A4S09_03710 [Proteobacteria bacterium SG_bin7]